MKKSALEKKVKNILRRPYHRVFIPEANDGGYTSLIQEFPGCISCGDTIEEANRMIMDAADGWVEACLKRGLKIPEPIEWGHEKPYQKISYIDACGNRIFFNNGKINNLFSIEVHATVKKASQVEELLRRMLDSIGVSVTIRKEKP